MAKAVSVSDKGGAKIDANAFAQPVSHSKAEFQALIEAYKAQNPEKYALKKEALEKKLATL